MCRLKPMGKMGMAALVVGFQLFFAVAAQAHNLTITASASCVGDQAVISFSVGSEPGVFEHPNVVVRFAGTQVASGVLNPLGVLGPITGSAPAPALSSVVVLAEALGPWQDGFVGDTQTASTLVTIPTGCAEDLGRFTGGGYQILLVDPANTALARSTDAKGSAKKLPAGAIKITRGFTIHCDLLLSNNLEVNWQDLNGDSHQFHMTQHTDATCSDNELYEQKPPRSPVDTIVGKGTGRYDNQDGYTIEFTLIDAGEPGAKEEAGESNDDKAALKIYETANPSNVVLEVPLQDIQGGNVQAHYDQPHNGNGNK